MKRQLESARKEFQKEWSDIESKDAILVDSATVAIAKAKQRIIDAVDGRLRVLNAYVGDHFETQVAPLLPIDVPGEVEGLHRTDAHSSLAPSHGSSSRVRTRGPRSRGYSEARVEGSGSRQSDANAKTIDNATSRNLLGAILSIFDALLKMPSFTLDVRIQSVPITGAEFRLAPQLYEEGGIDGRTNMDVHNIFRGKWNYTVTKKGYRARQGQFDLVREDRRVLQCVYDEKEDEESSAHCDVQ
jgi:hypothetical protein